MEPVLGDPQYGAQSLLAPAAPSHLKVYNVVNLQDHILVIDGHGPCGNIRPSFCSSDLLRGPHNYNLLPVANLHRHRPSRIIRDQSSTPLQNYTDRILRLSDPGALEACLVKEASSSGHGGCFHCYGRHCVSSNSAALSDYSSPNL